MQTRVHPDSGACGPCRQKSDFLSDQIETFPLPWPPGQEPESDLRLQAIATVSRELVAKRDEWLGGTDGKKRTLTRLYNARPAWLDLAHRKLDEAVFAAYGWTTAMSDEDILAALLALNQARAK